MTESVVQRLADRAEQQFFGKYRGIVADNKDPLKLGRLKLILPSVLGESEDCITDWAWPCVPYGGAANQGWFAVPEKDAKVWVEFEEGNLDLPIWVGTFWSAPDGASEVPEEAQKTESDAKTERRPERKVFQTTSGHVLEFCDVAGKESITLRHKGGATVALDEKGSVIITSNDGDRKRSMIYLNAGDKELTLADQNGNLLAMKQSGVLLSNKDGAAIDLSGEAIQLIAKNVHIRSETVSLGEGAMEPAVLGMTFSGQYDGHTHMTAWGPSGPPLPIPMPLSVPTSPAISKAVKVK